jgi:predicted secreted protein
MATFQGFDGVLKFADADTASDTPDISTATAIGNLRNFTIETSQDTIETTTMSSGGHREYKAGLSTFTISGDVYFDYTDAVQIAMEQLTSKDDSTTANDAVATFEAYPSGTATGNAKYSGSCIITSWSVTSNVDGVVEASFSAQGTGVLAVEAAS